MPGMNHFRLADNYVGRVAGGGDDGYEFFTVDHTTGGLPVQHRRDRTLDCPAEMSRPEGMVRPPLRIPGRRLYCIATRVARARPLSYK